VERFHCDAIEGRLEECVAPREVGSEDAKVVDHAGEPNDAGGTLDHDALNTAQTRATRPGRGDNRTSVPPPSEVTPPINTRFLPLSVVRVGTR
jgi:hypothetical protein